MLSCIFCFDQANSPDDVPAVIAAPHHYLISIYRNNLFFLAVVQSEGTCRLLMQSTLSQLILQKYSVHHLLGDRHCTCSGLITVLSFS